LSCLFRVVSDFLRAPKAHNVCAALRVIQKAGAFGAGLRSLHESAESS